MRNWSWRWKGKNSASAQTGALSSIVLAHNRIWLQIVMCALQDAPCWTFSSFKEYPWSTLDFGFIHSYLKLSKFPKSPSTGLPSPNCPRITQCCKQKVAASLQGSRPHSQGPSLPNSSTPSWRAKHLTLQFGEQQFYHRQSFCSYGRVAFVF